MLYLCSIVNVILNFSVWKFTLTNLQILKVQRKLESFLFIFTFNELRTNFYSTTQKSRWYLFAVGGRT